MPSRSVVLVLALTAASQTGAQTGGSRVEEEANRPMRMILEAAKIKGRAKPAEGTPAPAAASMAAPATAKPTPVVSRAAPAPAAGATTPAAAAPAAAEPDPRPQSTVATVEAEAVPRTTIPDPTPAPDAAPAAAAAPVEDLAPLKLLNIVEPVTPRVLLGKLRGEIRVDVAFTVAADGSVTEPSVRSSSHPQMNAAVLEAVGQWRYQPIARAREHAVQVVLRPGG